MIIQHDYEDLSYPSIWVHCIQEWDWHTFQETLRKALIGVAHSAQPVDLLLDISGERWFNRDAHRSLQTLAWSLASTPNLQRVILIGTDYSILAFWTMLSQHLEDLGASCQLGLVPSIADALRELTLA